MDERFLAERAAFEIVNSIEIDAREISTLNSLSAVSSVVRWRRQPRPLARRLIDRVTGKTRRFDQLFEGQTADALRGFYEIINDVRSMHAESDLILAKTANKVIQLHGALHAFKGEMVDMLDQLRSEVVKMNVRVEALEARGAVDNALLRLRDPELGKLTLDRLWMEMDQLWWGDFGVSIRREPGGDAAKGLIEQLQLGVAAVVRERCSAMIESNVVLPVQPLLDGVVRLAPPDHETRELLALDPDVRLRPLTMALVGRSLGRKPDPEERQRVPLLTTPSGLAERLLNETRRGTGE